MTMEAKEGGLGFAALGLGIEGNWGGLGHVGESCLWGINCLGVTQMFFGL